PKKDYIEDIQQMENFCIERGIAISLYDLVWLKGKVYFNLGRYTESEMYALQAIEAARIQKLPWDELFGLSLLASIYRQDGKSLSRVSNEIDTVVNTIKRNSHNLFLEPYIQILSDKAEKLTHIE
ncbi:MAG TPA: hypothetical protein VN376_06695, partial [Longilinea sp.]|nr:hypothetical protein [Longilinea sp.]